MARLKNLQTNYTSGELDPKLRGRRTLKHWFNGARYIRNAILRPQGGLRRRDGGEYKDTTFYNVKRHTNLVVDGTLIDGTGGTVTTANWTRGELDAGLIDGVLTTFSSDTTGTTINFIVDWGVGETELPTGLKIVEAPEVHFLGDGLDRGVTVVVEGSATGVFGGEEVLLGTVLQDFKAGATSAGDPALIYDIPLTTVSVGYRYHRVTFTWVTATSPFCAEVQFFEGGVPSPLGGATPNGGTLANIFDDDATTELVTTANVTTTDPYVVCEFEFPEARDVAFIDVEGLRMTTAVPVAEGIYNGFRVQYTTDGGSSWFDYGEPFDLVDTNDITRRRSEATGARNAKTFRLVKIGDQDGGTSKVAVDNIVMYEELATISPVKQIPFIKDLDTRYMGVMTDQNIRFYKAGVFVADVKSPILGTEIAATDYVQSLDTLLLFNRLHQVHKIFRELGDVEWSSAPQVFTNIPQFDFGDGAEDSFSDTRGWPRCGTFFQGRLWMASPTERPDTVFASKSDALFNFDVGTGLDDEAIVKTIVSDSLVQFHQLYAGRHLYAFGESAEFYAESSDDTIQTPDNFALRRTTKSGSVIGVEPWEVDGAVLFLQRGGSVLREFIFTDTEAAYQASNVSLLSAHLVRSPVDTALRKAISDDDADILFATNSDGTLATFVTLRTQEINAWMMQHTDGSYRSVGIDLDDTFTVVERTVGGSQVQFFEHWRPDQLLDASIRGTAGAPTTSISGLTHLEGRVVEAIVNDVNVGTYTVASGAITVTSFTGDYQVGLAFPNVILDQDFVADPDVELASAQVYIGELPVEGALPDGSIAAQKKRVADAGIEFRLTRHAAINGDDVPFRQLGDAILGQPVPLFTGTHRTGGFLGWDLNGALTITQNRAGELELLAISKKVAA